MTGNTIAKWYILHTGSGSEKRVKKMIEEQIVQKNMVQYFEDIIIPTIKIPEIKRGRQVVTEKKLMPGYILIKMVMNDKSWHLVKTVRKISNFLGSKTVPTALSEVEVANIFRQLESQSENIKAVSLYNVGDKIQVIDGPFEAFAGSVEEVNAETQKLKISVSIFGKSTPIELDFTQVTKS